MNNHLFATRGWQRWLTTAPLRSSEEKSSRTSSQQRAGEKEQCSVPTALHLNRLHFIQHSKTICPSASVLETNILYSSWGSLHSTYALLILSTPGVVAHASNPSFQEADRRTNWEFTNNLDYIIHSRWGAMEEGLHVNLWPLSAHTCIYMSTNITHTINKKVNF